VVIVAHHRTELEVKDNFVGLGRGSLGSSSQPAPGRGQYSIIDTI